MNTILSDQDTQSLLDILVIQFAVPREQLTPEVRIIEDLNADSLDRMEIIMAIEDRFGVSIPDDAWENVSTVGDTLEVLAKYRGV